MAGRLKYWNPHLPARDFRVPCPKLADPHYMTAEHRAWADAVIARAGGRCQWPGCTKAVPEHRMVADHIVEIKDGGAKFDPANGQCICIQHNTLKGIRARQKRHGLS